MKKPDAKYDSNEELWLAYYLDELKEADFVAEWKSQPQEYVLSEPVVYTWLQKLKTKGKLKPSALLQGHKYTPDFMVSWNSCARNIFFNTIDDGINLKNVPFFAHSGNNISIVDIKPAFDMNNMTRLFVINQKWMMDKYGIYVQKIIISKETRHGKPVKNPRREWPEPKKKILYTHSTWNGLFPKTFTPERYFLTDNSMKPRKIRYNAIRLDEYLKQKGGV